MRNKSDFILPKGRNNNLDKFVNAVKSLPVEQQSRRPYFRKNLNKTEWDAFTNIKMMKISLSKKGIKEAHKV